MAKEEPCDCLDYQQQLAECKDSKCKQCEEDKKAALFSIEKLNKKVFTLTIILVIAITLMGKDLADKLMESFNTFEQINKKTETIEIPSNTKEGETSEVSTIYELPSFWFS